MDTTSIVWTHCIDVIAGPFNLLLHLNCAGASDIRRAMEITNRLQSGNGPTMSAEFRLLQRPLPINSSADNLTDRMCHSAAVDPVRQGRNSDQSIYSFSNQQHRPPAHPQNDFGSSTRDEQTSMTAPRFNQAACIKQLQIALVCFHITRRAISITASSTDAPRVHLRRCSISRSECGNCKSQPRFVPENCMLERFRGHCCGYPQLLK